MSCNSNNNGRSAGFTLVEMLLAVSILAAVMTVSFMAFSTVSRAWQKSIAMAEDLHHGDFIMDQLMMALRSAYYPEDGQKHGAYGFVLESDGENDIVSWVKLGTALVGRERSSAGAHRVEVSIQTDKKGETGFAFKAWGIFGQPEDFDPEKLEPVMLSNRVRGLKIRTGKKKIGDEIDWEDRWEDTNRIPSVVEITLLLAPVEKNAKEIEIKRICPIPGAAVSWSWVDQAGTASGSAVPGVQLKRP